MSIFVIGDLHLSFNTNKPMDVFGEDWFEHYKKIELDWKSRVSDEDLVIIPGDTSWAMNFQEARVDLEWLEALPGQKVLIKGNHDYWWSSKTKMDSQFESISFIHNSIHSFKDIAVCGTRGWLCPNEVQFTEDDEKIYKREAARLENSLKMAVAKGYNQIVVALHFPPTNDKREPSMFTEIIERYPVTHVVYGHIHSKEYFNATLKGLHNGVLYYLTSCDYLAFKLLELDV